eukprot:1161391-Pelagomonas_calceolata.AAC.7
MKKAADLKNKIPALTLEHPIGYLDIFLVACQNLLEAFKPIAHDAIQKQTCAMKAGVSFSPYKWQEVQHPFLADCTVQDSHCSWQSKASVTDLWQLKAKCKDSLAARANSELFRSDTVTKNEQVNAHI